VEKWKRKKSKPIRAKGGKSKMRAKGTVRARHDDSLEKIKSQWLRRKQPLEVGREEAAQHFTLQKSFGKIARTHSYALSRGEFDGDDRLRFL
jgi:hypothetical protein